MEPAAKIGKYLNTNMESLTDWYNRVAKPNLERTIPSAMDAMRKMEKRQKNGFRKVFIKPKRD